MENLKTMLSSEDMTWGTPSMIVIFDNKLI